MKKQILSFGAHPDDIEIGCGGTEYQLIQQDYEVTHVYITSGEAGSQAIPKHELAALRMMAFASISKLFNARKTGVEQGQAGLVK